MLPWGYRHPRLKIAGIALAVGLLLGGLVTLAIGRPQLATLGTGQQSTADAIASDQPLQKLVPAKAKAKAKPKAKQRARHKAKAKPARAKARKTRRTASSAPVVAASTPDSADRADAKTGVPAAAPRRREVSRRVVSRRQATVSPERRATKKPAATSQPAPAPAPAPPASTPAPPPPSTPVPVATPDPPGNGHGHGHGNGNGGDDDVPGPGGG
jgi:hypothetical protein